MAHGVREELGTEARVTFDGQLDQPVAGVTLLHERCDIHVVACRLPVCHCGGLVAPDVVEADHGDAIDRHRIAEEVKEARLDLHGGLAVRGRNLPLGQACLFGLHLRPGIAETAELVDGLHRVPVAGQGGLNDGSNLGEPRKFAYEDVDVLGGPGGGRSVEEKGVSSAQAIPSLNLPVLQGP